MMNKQGLLNFTENIKPIMLKCKEGKKLTKDEQKTSEVLPYASLTDAIRDNHVDEDGYAHIGEKTPMIYSSLLPLSNLWSKFIKKSIGGAQNETRR